MTGEPCTPSLGPLTTLPDGPGLSDVRRTREGRRTRRRLRLRGCWPGSVPTFPASSGRGPRPELRAPLPELLWAPLGTCGQTAVVWRVVQVEPAGRVGPVQAAPELSAHTRWLCPSWSPGTERRGELVNQSTLTGRPEAGEAGVCPLPLWWPRASPSRSYPPAVNHLRRRRGRQARNRLLHHRPGSRESGDRCLFQQTGVEKTSGVFRTHREHR